ncbi:MAG: hypothetical protein AAFV51_07735, partial [Pseudomonadota bacterium]
MVEDILQQGLQAASRLGGPLGWLLFGAVVLVIGLFATAQIYNPVHEMLERAGLLPKRRAGPVAPDPTSSDWRAALIRKIPDGTLDTAGATKLAEALHEDRLGLDRQSSALPTEHDDYVETFVKLATSRQDKEREAAA